MARAFGTDGGITFLTGHNAIFMRWALQIGQGFVDETGYGDVWGQGKGTGVKRGAWSAVGYPTYNTASSAPGLDDLAAAGGTLILQVAPGCTFTMTSNAIITSGNIASDYEGQATLSFVGSAGGVIVEAWDETP